MNKKIQYRCIGRYKYLLEEEYLFATGIAFEKRIETEYLALNRDGVLVIKKLYAWDGASGPAIDTPNFMRGSLVHDALYQLMKLNLLPKRYRKTADKLLRQICRQDGMSFLRAFYVYRAVRRFGAFFI